MSIQNGGKKVRPGGKVAFITGGNGITGNAILEYLVTKTNGAEWSKIIITSNSSLASKIQDPRIVFIALDFTKSADELIELMRPICASTTHTYFSSYVHRDDFQELNTANRDIFRNYLTAITAVAPGLKNVTLQTGGKYYNVHIMSMPCPLREDHPRSAEHSDNFYYKQEDDLKEFQKGASWSWNVIRPQAIIGSTYKPNGMNSALTLALYFSICKKLGTKAPMPTNEQYWNSFDDVCYAPLIADLAIFVSTQSNCANEAFNCTNGDVICWRYLWPQLAGYFGISSEDAMELSQEPISLATWAVDKRPMWDKICEEANSPQSKTTFDCGTWKFQDWVFSRTWSTLLSVSKARKYGWTGYIDTYDAYVNTFDTMVAQSIIPKPR